MDVLTNNYFNPIPAIHDFCCLFLSYAYVAYIANNMEPDQTPYWAVWSGFIVFPSMIKSSLKWAWIYAADVKSRQYFQEKKFVRTRVNYYLP